MVDYLPIVFTLNPKTLYVIDSGKGESVFEAQRNAFAPSNLSNEGTGGFDHIGEFESGFCDQAFWPINPILECELNDVV